MGVSSVGGSTVVNQPATVVAPEATGAANSAAAPTAPVAQSTGYAPNSGYTGPTGTVKQGDATYEVTNGSVSLNGTCIGTVNNVGDYSVTINGQPFKGNVGGLIGAAVEATLSNGEKVDNRPTGEVDVGGQHFAVDHGVVSDGTNVVGTINNSGDFVVGGVTGNVTTVTGAIYNGTLSDNTAVDNRLNGDVHLGDTDYVIRSGHVFNGDGMNIGTVDEKGGFAVKIGGRNYSGNVGDLFGASYLADRADGTQSRNPPLIVGIDGSTLVPDVDKSGAEMASDTMEFMTSHMNSKAYKDLTWTFQGADNKVQADAVKADAMKYIANTPGLSAACDKMMAAAGAVPGKVEGLKVAFALNHFATVGAANGVAWGGTEAAVKEMLVSSAADFKAQPSTIRDTEGKSGITLAGPVGGSSKTFVNADGDRNKVDFATQPYSRPSGRCDAVLGGTKNTGQVDLVGTVVIKSGSENNWSVLDPSQRIQSNASDLAQLDKKSLSANTKNFDVVLEGAAGDWSVSTDKDNVVYVNSKTKTSVSVASSIQSQVRFASSDAVDTLAGQLKAGTAPASAPKKGVQADGTQSRNAPSGLVSLNGKNYQVVAGKVFLDGKRIGSVTKNGNYSVMIGGRLEQGNVNNLKGARVVVSGQ